MDIATDTAALDDYQLIARAAAGELQAFTLLMRRHNQSLYRAARSILRDEAEAEDAVQEAWWKAYGHLADFRAQAQPATWLTRIAINEALMRRRRNKSREALIQSPGTEPRTQDTSPMPTPTAATADFLSPEHQAWRAELRALIERQVDALPEKYRTVFMLRGIQEMSTAEVAAALDMPEATVRVRYMRARRLLRSALQQEIDLHAAHAYSFAGARCDRIVAGVHARIMQARGDTP